MINDIKSAVKNIKSLKGDKTELRKFGVEIGAFLIFSYFLVLVLFKVSKINIIYAALILISLGLLLPIALKPFYKIWMPFAIMLGTIVGSILSPIILTFLFYIVLTPLGLIARVFGKDILDQKIDKERPSYWHEINTAKKDKKSYENQY